MEVRIRPADSYDIEELAKMLAKPTPCPQGHHADSRRQVKGLSMMIGATEERTVIVAERKGSIIGMVCAQVLISPADGGLSALIENLVVADTYKGLSVEVKLLAAAEGWARTLGAQRLQLLCEKVSRLDAPGYERAGWMKAHLECRVLDFGQRRC